MKLIKIISLTLSIEVDAEANTEDGWRKIPTAELIENFQKQLNEITAKGDEIWGEVDVETWVDEEMTSND